MNTWLDFYQNIPGHIDPIAIRVGSFSVNWYALMYLIAFAAVYLLLIYRIKKLEGAFEEDTIFDCLIYCAFGLLLGGRLGEVLFYNFNYYAADPWRIISPWDVSGGYVGISGMSYFGGLIGIILAGMIFAAKRKLDFWKLADFLIPAIPLGYFFGRIGNFLNGELYGRVTDGWWGMHFSDGLSGQGLLRHPSQLYEAFFEGLILFLILWSLRNGFRYKNRLFQIPHLAVYLFGYGFFRFGIEFFREPDQTGMFANFLTLGQIFSVLTIIAALGIFFAKNAKIHKTIRRSI